MPIRRIPVENLAPSSPRAARILELVGEQRTLHQVLEWTRAHQPPLLNVEVVTQDEFTHDVIVAAGEDVWIVYDAT